MTITPEMITALIAILVAALSLYQSGIANAREMGRLTVKVDTLWDFQMRRGEVEAVRKGIATVNSPVAITDEAKCWMQPLIGPLREFYKNTGRHMTQRELYIEIERRFGDRIKREVCIPHNLDQGACLLIAVQAIESLT